MLASLWTDPHTEKSYGYSSVGTVTFESASYVARYATKKITGAQSDTHYLRLSDPQTGELSSVKPEYCAMSNGIATSWFDEFWSDIYPHDFIIVNGRKFSPPRRYDELLLLKDPDMHAYIKSKRIKNGDSNPNNSLDRLFIREFIQNVKKEKLIRTLPY
jgi:hypothetical protein